MVIPEPDANTSQPNSAKQNTVASNDGVMCADNGIQLNRCARHESARELSSSESGSRGGRGLLRLVLLLWLSSRPMRGECLLLFPCGGDNENKSRSLSPRGEMLCEGSPCVGEGGGVAVLTIRRCFSKMFSRNVPSMVKSPGTWFSKSLCSSSFRWTLRSSEGATSSSEVVRSMIKPRLVVRG